MEPAARNLNPSRRQRSAPANAQKKEEIICGRRLRGGAGARDYEIRWILLVDGWIVARLRLSRVSLLQVYIYAHLLDTLFSQSLRVAEGRQLRLPLHYGKCQ